MPYSSSITDQGPTPIDKWHGIIYKLSHTDTSEHTKDFDYLISYRYFDPNYVDSEEKKEPTYLRYGSPILGQNRV